MTQPITAAPVTEVPFGLGAAVGAGVDLPVTDPLDPGHRWATGQGYYAEGVCGTDGLVSTPDECAAPGDKSQPRLLAEGDYASLVSAQDGQAFRIEVGVKCSTFGQPAGDILATFHDKADRLLDLRRWAMIANELWTGAKVPSNRHLASPDAIVLASQPVSPRQGLSLLEDAFGVYVPGGQRIIHAPARAIPYFTNELTAQGSRLYTMLRTLVLADDGYQGTGPDGLPPADGVVWLYGTGPLTVRLDPNVFHPEPELVDAVRARENTIMVRSQQLAAVTWLCGHLAVPILVGD